MALGIALLRGTRGKQGLGRDLGRLAVLWAAGFNFAAFFVFFAMANSGLPGTSGFVGEFMVILAAFQQNPLVAAVAALTLIIGAAYTLWMVKRVIFGEVANEQEVGAETGDLP